MKGGGQANSNTAGTQERTQGLLCAGLDRPLTEAPRGTQLYFISLQQSESFVNIFKFCTVFH